MEMINLTNQNISIPEMLLRSTAGILQFIFRQFEAGNGKEQGNER